MPLLAFFDSRTLVTCQIIMASAFAIKFFSIHHLYPRVHGVRSIAIAYALSVAGGVLLLLRGIASPLLTVALANLFLLAAINLTFDGVASFMNVPRRTIFLWSATILVMAVICFCGLNRRGIVPRIVSCALDVALVRGLIAFVAFRRAKWSASPVTKRTLASIMAVLAAGSILHALLVLIHPGPDDLFHADLIHILPTLLQMIQICTIGIGLFILIAHRLIVQSQEESLHDPLSGTLNRRGIETRLTRELGRPNLTRKKLFVALIDLDNFKAINDSHGHRTGDAVLRTVAQTITAQLRATDYFGRYGGDEFLLLLNRVSCEEAVAVANRLNETVNSLHTSRIVAADITLSIGITEIIPTDDTISLVERADQALYRAKRDGRNCVRVVPPTAPDHADSPTPGLTT